MSHLVDLVTFAEKFSDLIVDHARWSDKTFGDSSVRGPMGPLKHLEKEAREAQEAVGSTENLKEELADCLLLLLDASRRADIRIPTLIEAAQMKMEKNRNRVWPTSKPDEACEHVE